MAEMQVLVWKCSAHITETLFTWDLTNLNCCQDFDWITLDCATFCKYSCEGAIQTPTFLSAGLWLPKKSILWRSWRCWCRVLMSLSQVSAGGGDRTDTGVRCLGEIAPVFPPNTPWEDIGCPQQIAPFFNKTLWEETCSSCLGGIWLFSCGVPLYFWLAEFSTRWDTPPVLCNHFSVLWASMERKVLKAPS